MMQEFNKLKQQIYNWVALAKFEPSSYFRRVLQPLIKHIEEGEKIIVVNNADPALRKKLVNYLTTRKTYPTALRGLTNNIDIEKPHVIRIPYNELMKNTRPASVINISAIIKNALYFIIAGILWHFFVNYYQYATITRRPILSLFTFNRFLGYEPVRNYLYHLFFYLYMTSIIKNYLEEWTIKIDSNMKRTLIDNLNSLKQSEFYTICFKDNKKGFLMKENIPLDKVLFESKSILGENVSNIYNVYTVHEDLLYGVIAHDPVKSRYYLDKITPGIVHKAHGGWLLLSNNFTNNANTALKFINILDNKSCAIFGDAAGSNSNVSTNEIPCLFNLIVFNEIQSPVSAIVSEYCSNKGVTVNLNKTIPLTETGTKQLVNFMRDEYKIESRQQIANILTYFIVKKNNEFQYEINYEKLEKLCLNILTNPKIDLSKLVYSSADYAITNKHIFYPKKVITGIYSLTLSEEWSISFTPSKVYDISEVIILDTRSNVMRQETVQIEPRTDFNFTCVRLFLCNILKDINYFENITIITSKTLVLYDNDAAVFCSLLRYIYNLAVRKPSVIIGSIDATGQYTTPNNLPSINLLIFNLLKEGYNVYISANSNLFSTAPGLIYCNNLSQLIEKVFIDSEEKNKIIKLIDAPLF